MGATMKDVAELAGVSIKTVSNLLNDYPYMTAETKAKVEKAMAELDYRPNIAARNLRRGRTGVIALALPTLSSPYFAEIANLIVKEAEAQQLTVLIEATHGDLEREKLVAEGFRSQLLDGMILQPWAVSERYVRGRSDKTPLVLLGERRARTADSVAIDSRAAAAAAVEHLLGLGRRRVGAIGSPPHGPEGRQQVEPLRRHEGYAQALEAFGVPFDAALIVYPEGDHSPEEVAVVVDELLAKAPDLDGVFCFNDRIGTATIRSLVSRGVAVPDDIAVVGIDDIEAARLVAPSLSTIAPDKAGIARIAVEMLTERMAGSSRGARQVTAEFEFIARESTMGTQ